MNDLTKLPKWAQEHIARLERKIAEYDESIRRKWCIAPKDTEEGIVIDPYGEHPLWVDGSFTTRFWVEPHRLAIDVDMWVKNTMPGKPGLNISAFGIRTTNALIVHPVASNVIHVGKGEW